MMNEIQLKREYILMQNAICHLLDILNIACDPHVIASAIHNLKQMGLNDLAQQWCLEKEAKE
jgi:hypothetical protein